MPAALALKEDLDDGAAWTEAARDLQKLLRQEGIYTPRPFYYVRWIAAILSIHAAGYAALLLAPSWPLRIPCLFVVAFVLVQGGLIAHDAGHHAITKRAWLREMIGHVFMTLLDGLAFTNWKKTHGQHHLTTNDEARDPDIGVNLFALHPESARRKRGFFRLTTRLQHVLLWPLITFQPLTMRYDSVRFALRTRSRTDLLLLPCQYVIWLLIPSLVLGPASAFANFFLINWIAGVYMPAIFIVNHTALPTFPPKAGLPFLYQQVVTSRNLPQSRVADLVMGHLNSQIEHHIAPTAPSANLPRARELVRPFCERYGIEYREQGFLETMAAIAKHVRAMARIASSPGDR